MASARSRMGGQVTTGVTANLEAEPCPVAFPSAASRRRSRQAWPRPPSLASRLPCPASTAARCGDRMSHLRVLCLHGYHGSGAILRDQMESLTATLRPNVEFVYVNAPSLATDDFGWWHEGFNGWERTRDWAIELVCAGPGF